MLMNFGKGKNKDCETEATQGYPMHLHASLDRASIASFLLESMMGSLAGSMHGYLVLGDHHLLPKWGILEQVRECDLDDMEGMP